MGLVGEAVVRSTTVVSEMTTVVTESVLKAEGGSVGKIPIAPVPGPVNPFSMSDNCRFVEDEDDPSEVMRAGWPVMVELTNIARLIWRG